MNACKILENNYFTKEEDELRLSTSSGVIEIPRKKI